MRQRVAEKSERAIPLPTSKDKNIVTTAAQAKAIDFSLAEKVTIGKDAANGGKPVD